MRLIIAEKPSLARAIAEALPGSKEPRKTHIRAGDTVVAWCAGHVLELAPPDAYDPALQRWTLESLPILPRAWKLVPTAPDLLDAIGALLPRATHVVHAGDPDREGQLLVDEVLEHLGYRGSVERLLVSDLNPDAVRRQLAALEPNTKYRPLYESALARQRADWLWGMNLSRLYTLLGRAGGYDGVLSVGRVQTPVLGLVVARDRAIAEFRPAPYFVLSATLRTAEGARFRALWEPGPAAAPYLDEQKRLLRRDVAERLVEHLCGRSADVVEHEEEQKSESPPLPYCLADLQVDGGKRLGLTAKQVLDACQSLYETHRLLTYPRSDCSHLPEGHFAQAAAVVASIRRQAPELAPATGEVDLSRRSKAWHDKKVTAHHAIIPTPGAPERPAALSPVEAAVYTLVARRYLAQFYASHEYLQTRARLELAGEAFVARGRQELALGWKALFADPPADSDTETGRAESKAPLPPLAKGQRVVAEEIAIADKRTEPPKAFSDASLIAAMTGVARFVRDARIKKILTETDGIGTPATRAAILETLVSRRLLARTGKTLVSTDAARALIAALPEVATTPDRTALWEASMRAIVERADSLDAFLARVGADLAQLVAQGRALGRIRMPPAAAPAPSARGGARAGGSRTHTHAARPRGQAPGRRPAHAQAPQPFRSRGPR